MALKSRTLRKRSSNAYGPAMPDGLTCVGASPRTIAGEKRNVPSITLRGEWLKALGFPIGAPIYLFAEAHGRMAICRAGLARPRWVHIVAPKRSR
jgi:hypothetical protein